MAPWFGPKSIGYGIGPKGWQGWLACALVVLIPLGTGLVATHVRGFPRWLVIAICAVTIAVFVGILAFKTEDD